MPAIKAIFLDDGGVMNDNQLRGPEWQRLVAEYLAPRLGGDGSAWKEANTTVLERQLARIEKGLPPGRSYSEVKRMEEVGWLREMCDLVGVDAPTRDDDSLTLVHDTWRGRLRGALLRP